MKIIIKKKSSVLCDGAISKNIITAGLAFTLSTFTALKPMDKENIISNKKSQNNQYNELKIESDAYDMIRKLL
ncbi:MAG: hypothetical protein DSZ07_04255 [Sulfurovum sp.]|nr:MAG: hypothetical protein DSZ07_04255 [Sulfurovum sp.]